MNALAANLANFVGRAIASRTQTQGEKKGKWVTQ
jgi:hypothetical protein